MSSRREVAKTARRVLDLKYLATFRSSAALKPAAVEPEASHQAPSEAQPAPFIVTPKLETKADEEWPHYLFATSVTPQPCFDKSNRPVEGADLEADERVMLVVGSGLCRTTRVATTGELITARVDLTKFKDFQTVP
jgi:hypothetical protein